MSTAPIVVGVDLSRGACEAVWWALIEAQRRNAPVLLLHAPDGADAELAGAAESGLGSQLDAAEAVVQTHLAHATQLAPDVDVQARVVNESPVHALTDLSRDAELLVLGSRGRDGFRVSALGSVGQRIAVHAHCPVVIVPEGSPRLLNRRIVAGVSATRAGRHAVDFAADEADRWGGELVLLRARAGGEEAQTVASIDTAEALARVIDRHPELAVEICTPAADAADAIAAETRRSDLAVLGCHHSEDVFNCRLGGVPSGVLARADCPVVLVGQQH
jgi:nucleotide-binding universal stress UspA family protein